MRRLRTIPPRLWLFAAAALITTLQYIGWHRVGDTIAAGVHAAGRTIGPAITLSWPFVLALAFSVATSSWGRRIASSARDRSDPRGESGMPGLTLAVCAALGLLLACVLVFPRLLYPPLTQRALDEVASANRVAVEQTQQKLQNDARTTLLQGLGGTAVLLGVYFTFRQLRIARLGQVTERFTRAVDQLGNDSQDVQLGGIYALQQISRVSDDERSAIHEILASYVRIHAPWKDPHDPGPVDVNAIPRLREWAPGVQAAMLALGRRGKATPIDAPLGLMGVKLQRLRLSSIDIRGGANLAGALFWRSSLINAALGGANLRGAKLGWTDLRHAGLDGADLREADLRGADLCDIKHLDRANLHGARANVQTRFPDGFSWQAAGVLMDPES